MLREEEMMIRQVQRQGQDEGGRLSREDVTYAVELTVSCLVSYLVITHLLAPFVDASSSVLGGMWAVVATVFVFRDTRDQSVPALARLLATCVSFVLCFVYLVVWPFSPVGMAALIGIGTLVMLLLGRPDDIVTTGITTAVVMVVAGLSPHTAWEQPILRLVDTIVGVVVGLAGAWIGGMYWSLRNRHPAGGSDQRAMETSS
jgi:uncharacterized membrane protein YccC